jgi:hypothetical protein
LTTTLLIAASCIDSTLLVAAIYFTRATGRRVVGALAGGLAVAAVGVGIETLAHNLGWWGYPGIDAPAYGPPPMYPLIVVMFGLLSLIGWRISRRFGWRGQVVFLTVLAIVGTFRDYVVAERLLKVIAFRPGPGMVLCDAALWAGLTAFAQAVMRLVAGPAQADPLARRPAEGG